jgi:polar amino acid transport system substrate-binding protein
MASLLSYEPFEGEPKGSRRVPVRSSFWIRPIARDAVRVGLVGCGNFSRSVLLPELNKIRTARIHAIAAASGANAKPMAKKYGAAYVTTDADQLFADAEIDAVVIATRHHLHAELARKALEAGKHVFVEKPMAMNAEDAVALCALAKDRGRHLVVGHNRRYAPLTRKLLDARPPGPAMITYVMNIRPLPADHWTLNKAEGGGRLLGESDHFFDMLNLFADSDPHAVSSWACLGRGQEIHESCNFMVQVRYANGSIGTLVYTDMGHANFPTERLEVYCGGSVLRLEDYARAEVLGNKGWKTKGRVEKGHAQELRNFVEVVLGRAEPIATAEDGLAATLVAQAAFRSMADTAVVRL